MTTLRVIGEPLLSPTPNGKTRYALELTREVIARAPAGCDVEAILAAHSAEEVDGVTQRLGGPVQISMLPVPAKELSRAWQYGLRVPLGGGMIHAPTLLAPLFKHDRLNDDTQTVVTIHDAVPWTHPGAFGSKSAGWRRAMAKRAYKHADAVVVPTHAVAEQLQERLPFGDRIRVISGAASPSLQLPSDAERRAADLQLPGDFVLAIGSLSPRLGFDALIRAMSLPASASVPLLVVGPAGLGERTLSTVAMESGLPEGRVRCLGRLDDGDLAVLLDRARALIVPSLAEGFGLPVLEAFQFGTPVIHSDDPALLEVAGGAGSVVEISNDTRVYGERIAHAIGEVLTDSAYAERLSVHGLDRVRAYSWQDSADRVWQLHADL